jgi:hypothetical protein
MLSETVGLIGVTDSRSVIRRCTSFRGRSVLGSGQEPSLAGRSGEIS